MKCIAYMHHAHFIFLVDLCFQMACIPKEILYLKFVAWLTPTIFYLLSSWLIEPDYNFLT